MQSFSFMDFLNKLLDYYQLTQDQYHQLIRPLTFDDLPKLTDYPEIPKIVEKIFTVISQKKKIMVYGDYDCDGVLSTSIIVKTFQNMGVEVGYYIPNRYQDGYGLNVEKVIQIAEKGYQLIITVDNGISAFEAIELANSLGLEVIITDHHEIGKTVPQVFGILHPIFKAIKPNVLCGAVMALILSAALLEKYEPYLVALSAIATIADMMPLIGINRDLVRLGIQILNENSFPCITKLAENQIIDEETIGMKIVPSINAIGRMIENNSVNRLVKLFLSNDLSEIDSLISWVKSINNNRKEEMNSALLQLPNIDDTKSSIILLTNEREGLIGLLANRLLNKYEKPVFVFTPDSSDPKILMCSVRTPVNLNLLPLFEIISPLLLSHGGHSNAGGFTLKEEDFLSIKSKIYDYFTNIPFQVLVLNTITLKIQEISWDNYYLIKTLSPYGNGWKKPIFNICGISTNSLSYIKEGNILSTSIGVNVRLLGFGINKTNIEINKKVNFEGFLKENTYKNNKELVFNISKFYF